MSSAASLRASNSDAKSGFTTSSISTFVNLFGCEVGDETRIGTFVEIQKGECFGQRYKISSHTFICEGVTKEDEVFIGRGVKFINARATRRRCAAD